MSADSAIHEIVLSESVLDHEVVCESNAHYAECLVEVSHLFRRDCGDVRKMVCADTAEYVEWASIDGYCAVCDRNCAECWSVVPV